MRQNSPPGFRLKWFLVTVCYSMIWRKRLANVVTFKSPGNCVLLKRWICFGLLQLCTVRNESMFSPTVTPRMSACSCISNLLDVIPPSTCSWAWGTRLSWFIASRIWGTKAKPLMVGLRDYNLPHISTQRASVEPRWPSPLWSGSRRPPGQRRPSGSCWWTGWARRWSWNRVHFHHL